MNNGPTNLIEEKLQTAKNNNEFANGWDELKQAYSMEALKVIFEESEFSQEFQRDAMQYALTLQQAKEVVGLLLSQNAAAYSSSIIYAFFKDKFSIVNLLNDDPWCMEIRKLIAGRNHLSAALMSNTLDVITLQSVRHLMVTAKGLGYARAQMHVLNCYLERGWLDQTQPILQYVDSGELQAVIHKILNLYLRKAAHESNCDLRKGIFTSALSLVLFRVTTQRDEWLQQIAYQYIAEGKEIGVDPDQILPLHWMQMIQKGTGEEWLLGLFEIRKQQIQTQGCIDTVQAQLDDLTLAEASTFTPKRELLRAQPGFDDENYERVKHVVAFLGI